MGGCLGRICGAPPPAPPRGASPSTPGTAPAHVDLLSAVEDEVMAQSAEVFLARRHETPEDIDRFLRLMRAPPGQTPPVANIAPARPGPLTRLAERQGTAGDTTFRGSADLR